MNMIKNVFDKIVFLYHSNLEKREEKTQLELDKEKYNLSAEHVEILSKVDYEVVKGGKCSKCLFRTSVNNIPINCIDACRKNEYTSFQFKQIHKTQESLNESIEKEELKNGIEEPFSISCFATKKEHSKYIEFLTNEGMNTRSEAIMKHETLSYKREYFFKNSYDRDKFQEMIMGEDSMEESSTLINSPAYVSDSLTIDDTEETKQESKQQADHYKPTDEYDLETIEIIECVLGLLEGKITPLQGYYIGNEIKYTRRLGKKDDAKKEMYKIADYYSRLLNNKWIHEIEGVNK